MMSKTEISVRRDEWNYFFPQYNMPNMDTESFLRCSICGYLCDGGYSYIITNLKKAGILDENYIPVCCCCYFVKNNYGSYYCSEGHILDMKESFVDGVKEIVIGCKECEDDFMVITVKER